MFHTVVVPMFNVPLFYTAMAVSVPYCHGCQCFILSGLSVFHTVMAVSVSCYHGCQCFILSLLSVFHTVTGVSVSYCRGFHCLTYVMGVSVLCYDG